MKTIYISYAISRVVDFNDEIGLNSFLIKWFEKFPLSKLTFWTFYDRREIVSFYSMVLCKINVVKTGGGGSLISRMFTCYALSGILTGMSLHELDQRAIALLK